MKSRPIRQAQNLHHKPRWLAFMLALLLMLIAGASTAAVRATLDRDTVYEGDTFTLLIESDGRQSGLQPDLAPLEKNFEVLGTSTSTQVSIFNGRRSDKTRWQVQLQPRRRGQLRIPSLNVGGQQTAPLELKVAEAPQQATAQAGQHVFVEAEINSAARQTYVQQQIPYTVRLYYDERLQEGELIAPEPENAVVEQLGKDKRYSTVRNGHQFNVIERHYVISPEKSGSLHIPPASFRGRIAMPRQNGPSRRPGSMMEEFFNNSPFGNDPFFSGSPFASPGKPITVRSRSIDMAVQPRPVTKGSNWLPAEAVTLQDSWTQNPPQFKVGEPVSRTITIQTRGLAGSQIPELSIAAPANTRLYPESPGHESRTDGKTIYGIRTQSLTYIPGAQGTLEVPAITLNWWDTSHNKAASTTLPRWQFKVSPGAAGAAIETQAVNPASEATQTDTDQAGAIPATIKPNWPWLLTASGLLLALVLLVVTIGRRVAQRRQLNATITAKQTPQDIQNDQPDQKSALQALQKACAANEQHAAAQALLMLGHTHWPDDPPRSLDALAARIESGQAYIRELDRSLYAAGDSNWNGAALWEEFRHGLRQRNDNKHEQDDELTPLYPQRS